MEFENESNEIPFDQWTKVSNPELEKKGIAEWVYRPSHYKGPLAIDGFIRKEAIDAPGARITLSKEEAKIFWPDKE